MQKIIFISDIHGMASTLQKALLHAEHLQADHIVILGDILYHGPRNGVPDLYDPTTVAQMLNDNKDRILAVRGNCDAEVDQMMLKFPIMADYSELLCSDRRIFLTHGHIWNEDNLPELPAGSILAHGHTHVAELKSMNKGITIFNPGSISLPKNTLTRTFGVLDGKNLSVRELDTGKVFLALETNI